MHASRKSMHFFKNPLFKEMEMKISKNSWRYKLWAFTFFFSGATPQKTTPWRYRLRTGLMPFLVAVAAVCTLVLWAIITFLGNTMTILSGQGLYVTWDEQPQPYIRVFTGLPIGSHLVSPGVIALFSWACLLAAILVYLWPHEALVYGKIVVAVIAIFSGVYGGAITLIKLVDKAEFYGYRSQKKVELPEVTFFDPERDD